MFPFFFQSEKADSFVSIRFIKISGISMKAAVIRSARITGKEGQRRSSLTTGRMCVEIHMPQDVYIYDPDVSVPKNVRHVEIPGGTAVIKNGAFSGCSRLESIIIPDSVTEIGDYAFQECLALRSVTIPDSVTKIGYAAFNRCVSLQSVTMSSSITEIRNFTFYECSGLQSIRIPDGVTKIGDSAFDGCTGLRSVIIPVGVTEIEGQAFYRCSNLQSVAIPDGITRIAYNTFSDCSGLQSITIPDSVTQIDDNAFCRCSSLQSVTIPDNVTKIGFGAFSGCSALRSVTMPDHMTVINYSTFMGCSGLRTVTIPDGVTDIGGDAFSNCSGLQSVTIPGSVEFMGAGAFENCSALQSVTIPDGITEIESETFCNCSRLQSIVIPDGITKIGNKAFERCSGLQSITIPDGVTEIGYSAFEGCSALQSVTIPDGVTKIGKRAFAGCSGLQSITIPDSVTEIESDAFERCGTLQSVVIPDSVTDIGDNVFKDCSALQSVTMSDSITGIGGYAFAGCLSLRSITIPDGVTKIGKRAFSDCFDLQSVTIPDSVTEISNSAFENCFSLQSVTIPDSVTKIGGFAFCNCDLQSVMIPDSITEIGDFAFTGCSALKSLMYKGVNITAFINTDGYGINTFDVIKVLVEHRNPLNENTVRRGIDMAHRGRLDQWATNYPVFGEMRLPPAAKSVDGKTEEYLRRLFAAQKKTGCHVPKILDKLAIAVCVCGIPPERLAETFDVEYTRNLLSEKIPIVPAEACRCYYDRSTCNMLIRKGNISVMVEAIGLYNRSGRQECYRYLMDFILSHPDTKVEDLQYAVDHAEAIPMQTGTTPAQVRQHRTYMENLAEATKIEEKYGKIVPGFKLTDYPCNIDPIGVTYDGMTARVLDLSDEKDIALATRLGELTCCCQRLGRAGETAMMHGFLNPDAGFWVIEDKDGKVRAQAEIWETGKGVLVFDNIEFANTDKEHLTDRADRLRGVIAAWAAESGYENIIMGCGYNELGIGSMEQAPVPELRLTPEEVFALQKGNDAYISFRNMDDVHRYMRDIEYNPNDFVYTDADEQCVYIKKAGIVSDYLMEEYDCTLAEKRSSPGHGVTKEQGDEIVCK